MENILENNMADLVVKFKLVDGILQPSYYDFHIRECGIEFFNQVMGLKFEHGTKEGIDLYLLSNPIVGAEGEGDGWDGNYWEHYKSNMFGYPWRTTNIPHRKLHYWNLQELSKKYQYFRGVFNSGWDMNWFYRVNIQRDQIIVISAETIHDREKTKFKENGKTFLSNVLEDWLCVKQEFSPTFNKQSNGIWLLNGPYCGPTAEECIKISAEREEKIQELVRELTRNRVKELKIFAK